MDELHLVAGPQHAAVPLERHAVLYFIEQGLMPGPESVTNGEVVMSRNPLAATFQDFDWADEVLHAQVGRDWYVSQMPRPRGGGVWRCLLEPGARRLDRMEGWGGLTEHWNWWPDCYRQYCEKNGLPALPEVLKYAVTLQVHRGRTFAMFPGSA